jgi:NhaP-type Na+/H+ and K+/H+ antiporter
MVGPELIFSNDTQRTGVFKRTGIPAFLFLIFIGIVLGPIANILFGKSLVPILGIMADWTLLMVVFYSGINTKIETVIRDRWQDPCTSNTLCNPKHLYDRSFNSFLVWLGYSRGPCIWFHHWRRNNSRGRHTHFHSLNLSEKITAFIGVESVLNSIFSIVLFTAFVGTYQSGTVSVSTAFTIIASRFSVAIVVGGILLFCG